MVGRGREKPCHDGHKHCLESLPSRPCPDTNATLAAPRFGGDKKTTNTKRINIVQGTSRAEFAAGELRSRFWKNFCFAAFSFRAAGFFADFVARLEEGKRPTPPRQESASGLY